MLFFVSLMIVTAGILLLTKKETSFFVLFPFLIFTFLFGCIIPKWTFQESSQIVTDITISAVSNDNTILSNGVILKNENIHHNQENGNFLVVKKETPKKFTSIFFYPYVNDYTKYEYYTK